MSEENQQESLRDALEASFDSAVGNESSAPEESSSAPESAPAEGYEAPESTPPASEEPKKDYDRDEKGKFAEPEKAVKKEMTPGPKAGPKAAKAEGAPKEKVDPIERAPQAWKPEAREFWKQIPESARREILRTEQTVQQTLRDTVEDRRFAQSMRETIRPFEHFIKAEGSDPAKAVENLFSTAARFRTGNSYEVAAMVGQIIHNYGVGRFGNEFINTLDSMLAGSAPPQVDPQVAAIEQRMMQQFAPALQMAQQFQQQQQYQAQQMDSNARSEVGDFLSTAEFADDLRHEMADMIDMATARGQELSLKEAYDRACWANPEIRSILAERQARERAQQTNQVAQTARRAAVSVGGSPAFNANQEAGSSIRDAIEMAMRR